jgi:hypothetical protein
MRKPWTWTGITDRSSQRLGAKKNGVFESEKPDFASCLPSMAGMVCVEVRRALKSPPQEITSARSLLPTES